MSVVLSNNGVSKLASSLTTGATTLSVTTGEGSRYPAPTGGDWFPVTILKSSGAFEIVRCTARSGDVLTIVRAQEGTAAQSFSAGDRVDHRLTEAAFFAGGKMRGAINDADTQTIASATTTDIGAATSNSIDISGTTTITGLGTIASGACRRVRFTGVLTLTHNATSLILPGTANITTAANDTAVFISLGGGNWFCLSYSRASGKPVAFAYDRSNIVGTVAQSSGAPTGAVIERGSNANGEYTKFADGTMLCCRTSNHSSVAMTTAIGSLFYLPAGLAELDFAMPFLAGTVPQVISQVTVIGGIADCRPTSQATNVHGPKVLPTNPVSGTVNLLRDEIAYGRWF